MPLLVLSGGPDMSGSGRRIKGLVLLAHLCVIRLDPEVAGMVVEQGLKVV